MQLGTLRNGARGRFAGTGLTCVRLRHVSSAVRSAGGRQPTAPRGAAAGLWPEGDPEALALPLQPGEERRRPVLRGGDWTGSTAGGLLVRGHGWRCDVPRAAASRRDRAYGRGGAVAFTLRDDCRVAPWVRKLRPGRGSELPSSRMTARSIAFLGNVFPEHGPCAAPDHECCECDGAEVVATVDGTFDGVPRRRAEPTATPQPVRSRTS